MALLSWLYERMNRRPRTGHSPSQKPAPRFRPRLEALEGRDVPSTLTVTSNLDGARTPGTLRHEIMIAQSGDTIVFAPTAGSRITLTQGELVINKSLTIQGPGAGKLTLNGGTPQVGSRIFEVDGIATIARLSGLTLENGSGDVFHSGALTGSSPRQYDGNGGAILNFGVLTVGDCVFSHNSVGTHTELYDLGGAIYNAGSLTLTSCTLSGNSAFNSSGDGGAIYNAGSLNVTNCTLSGNSASHEGGGIYSGYGSTASVTGTALSGNTATQGSDIWNDGTTTLNGCYVDGKPATHASGGIYDIGHLTID